MTPIDAMHELLERLGAYQGVAVLVNDEELRQWPSSAVKAMKSQKLIVKASPANSAICLGCERECVMTVHTLPAKASISSHFIVCDKRSDTNRVAVSLERLIQWRCSVDLVSEFVASSLGLRRSARQKGSAGQWEIGMALGEKRSQMLCLKANDGLNLVAGENRIPLSEFIKFHDGQYALDNAMVRWLVDAATTADNRYNPSNARREVRKQETQAMYKSWQKAFRDLKKKHPNMSGVWYSLQIAKMDIAQGRDSETIRKKMTK